MGLIDKMKGELLDIIQWLDDSGDTLVKRFERYNNEIKHHASLIVREGQVAVFLNEGILADVFKPGTYTLETANLPVLATLQGWKYGFESPFKAEIYFCSTRQFTNLKWGTFGPCTMRDPEFGAVRVTAFGLYSIKIKDPVLFIREIVGTDGTFTAGSIEDNLRGKIGTRIKEVMPEAGIMILDLESKVIQLGEALKDKIVPAFVKLGLDLIEVLVQDIGLPEEVEKAIDKAGAMRIIGNMQSYTSYETASAIRDAANNPGGLAAAGAGVGLGLSMAGQVASSLAGITTQTGVTSTPPPLPSPGLFYVAIDGQQSGPHTFAVLQQLVESGRMTGETLVWKQSLINWEEAIRQDDLKVLFEIPPPLPSRL